MRWTGIVFVFLVVVVALMLLIYFFIPGSVTEFTPEEANNSFTNYNFSSGSTGVSSIQFYPNMRYKNRIISYTIDSKCSLKKKNDMEEAFNIISSLTILEFVPAVSGEEIEITCSDNDIVSGNTFVAGEGGVTNVTVVGNYHLIFEGKVLLIRDSNCPRPNVAIHELLHSMGFDHSQNPNNIMYETSSCDQTIGDEIPDFIDTLYSVPSIPDLSFEEVSAFMNGKYLNINMSIRNNGFADSPDSKIIISADGKLVREVDLESIGIGFGRKISLTNLWTNKINIESVELEIVSDSDELDKSNNVYVLSVKK